MSLAVSLRGCGASEGQFSLRGWIDDVGRAVSLLVDEGCRATWLVGSTTGGSVALLAAADDDRVRGVVTIAARADFDDWAREPDRIIEHCRRVRVITDPEYPSSVESWAGELAENRPVVAASKLAGRAFLVLHGAADLQVPPTDARAISMAHGSADLRMIQGGDHRLRHDPRAVAILLGWLDRQAS
jgi:putative redox protein